MLRRRFLLALPLLTACTPTRTPPPHEPPKPAQPPEPPAAPTAPTSPAAPTHGLWIWHQAPDRDTGTWGESQARTVLVTSEGRYELRILSPAAGSDPPFSVAHTGPAGEPRWEAALGTPFVPAGAMTSDGETIYATHHSAIASGASVSAVDRATGAIRWTTALEGLGPIGHDKYRNETQIALDERGLVVYGNEAQGQYTEVLDPRTGAQRSLTRPDPRLVSMQWEGKDADAPFDFTRGPSTLTVGDTRYVVTDPEDLERPATLERFDADQLAWTTTLRGEGSCGQAAMQIIDGRLWVAHYCAISSGTELIVVDPSSGRIERTIAVHALGPIAHSEYFSEVRLDERHGHVVVWGREAAGRYIEAIDPQTGLARVNLTLWR